jgi:hypothetical protein
VGFKMLVWQVLAVRDFIEKAGLNPVGALYILANLGFPTRLHEIDEGGSSVCALIDILDPRKFSMGTPDPSAVK